MSFYRLYSELVYQLFFHFFAQAVFLKKGTISANLSAKRSGSVPSSSAPPKKQAKLSAFFKKGPTPEMLAADNDQSQDQEEPVPVASTLSNTTEPVLEPVTAMERVSFDFEDETKCFHGEGRTITIEFTDFILVACYVPNSGEGLKRIAYRVDEWYKFFILLLVCALFSLALF